MPLAHHGGDYFERFADSSGCIRSKLDAEQNPKPLSRAQHGSPLHHIGRIG